MTLAAIAAEVRSAWLASESRAKGRNPKGFLRGSWTVITDHHPELAAFRAEFFRAVELPSDALSTKDCRSNPGPSVPTGGGAGFIEREGMR